MIHGDLLTDGFVVIDDFLEDPYAARRYGVAGDFKPSIGTKEITYIVHSNVPSDLRSEVLEKLGGVIQGRVCLASMFYRLAPLGSRHPSPVHQDSDSGDYTAVIYLSDADLVHGGGTSFLEEGTGDRQSWVVRDFVEMRFNRAVIFRADRWHRVEPEGGFGDTVENSRLVLVVFFSGLADRVTE